jgi:hypothetical protein
MLADLIMVSYIIIEYLKLIIECRYQEISVNNIVAIYMLYSGYKSILKGKVIIKIISN